MISILAPGIAASIRVLISSSDSMLSCKAEEQACCVGAHRAPRPVRIYSALPSYTLDHGRVENFRIRRRLEIVSAKGGHRILARGLLFQKLRLALASELLLVDFSLQF